MWRHSLRTAGIVAGTVLVLVASTLGGALHNHRARLVAMGPIVDSGVGHGSLAWASPPRSDRRVLPCPACTLAHAPGVSPGTMSVPLEVVAASRPCDSAPSHFHGNHPQLPFLRGPPLLG